MQKNDYNISIRVISSLKDVAPLEQEWNRLVHKSCKNPFLLNAFVKDFCESQHSNESPLILVISVNDKLVGVVPMVVKTKFGVQSVSFSNPSWCSDFIIDEQFKELCVSNVVDFIFKNLNCKYADFVFSCDSLTFELLLEHCRTRRIHVKTSAEMGHRIIPIRCSWSEFFAAQKRKDRKEMKRIERLVASGGVWRTVCVDGNKHPDEVIEKILEVEKNSWKSKWRDEQGEQIDEILMTVLRASQLLSDEPDFKWNVWFLELDGKTIAHCIELEYCETAFLTKTSYDEHYKKLSPGIFLQNTIVRELFNAGKINRIDFLSDLPYLKTWTDMCVPRTRVTLAKGLLPTTMKFISEDTVIGKIANKLFFNN